MQDVIASRCESGGKKKFIQKAGGDGGGRDNICGGMMMVKMEMIELLMLRRE